MRTSTTARKLRAQNAAPMPLVIPSDPRDLLGIRVCSPASVREVGTIVSVGVNEHAAGLCYVQWDHAVPGCGPARADLSTLRRIES